MGDVYQENGVDNMPDYIEVQVKKSMIDFANKKIKEVKFKEL